MNVVLRLGLIIIIACCMLITASYRLGGIGPSDIPGVAPARLPEKWQRAHSDTWVKLSRRALKEGDAPKAEQYALKALVYNMSSARAKASLMQVYAKKNNIESADLMAERAVQLWPSHADTRARVAGYWLKRNNLGQLLSEWNILLALDGSAHKKVFPALIKLLENPAYFRALLPYMENPPVWWDSFFAYISRNIDDVRILKTVYNVRVNTDKKISQSERKVFVRRLLKEKLWTEAYYTWMNGLDNQQLALSGLIYDGSFEGDLFQQGFSWSYSQPKGVQIKTTTTSGLKGRKGLNLRLNHRQLDFRHISQKLNLSPSQYQLSMRYRIDRLNTSKGLRWRVRCLDQPSKVLAESDLFNGRVPWSELRFSFVVPREGCAAQLLRLEASSPYRHHHAFKGSLWFDEMILKRQDTLAIGG